MERWMITLAIMHTSVPRSTDHGAQQPTADRSEPIKVGAHGTLEIPKQHRATVIYRRCPHQIAAFLFSGSHAAAGTRMGQTRLVILQLFELFRNDNIAMHNENPHRSFLNP